MSEVTNPENNSVDMIGYYQTRVSELTMEQLRLYNFAFNIMDAPSDTFQLESFVLYWEAEENIQKCRNELVKLKGIIE